MEHRNSRIRPLSAIEEAFTISNEAVPLCVTCVLHLSPGPEIRDLEVALEQLQRRHPLLQAEITKESGRFYFRQLDPAPPIACTIVRRADAETWRGVAEDVVNTTFDKRGPLVKCRYLPGEHSGDCELIVCFHHAVIDGISARLILHELLSLAGGVSLPEPPPPTALPKFPPAYRNLNLAKRLFSFAARQLKEEWQYSRKGAASPIPGHSRNAVLSFRLTPEISRKLSHNIGREGLNINSVLLAAITQTVLRHKHAGKDFQLARAISFADLRASVIPSVSSQELGCYISMLRLGVPVSKGQSIRQSAAQIQKALFRAGRRGEVYLMSKLSKHLMKMTLKLQNQRLGTSALSFIGKLDLEPQYGSIRLHNVTAFITNNRFGPELSAFGKVLFGSIGLDFTYLTAETDAGQAEQMVNEIKEKLEEMAKEPYI
jgi:NRPS condensation-like uncharacterized protein